MGYRILLIFAALLAFVLAQAEDATQMSASSAAALAASSAANSTAGSAATSTAPAPKALHFSPTNVSVSEINAHPGWGYTYLTVAPGIQSTNREWQDQYVDNGYLRGRESSLRLMAEHGVSDSVSLRLASSYGEGVYRSNLVGREYKSIGFSDLEMSFIITPEPLRNLHLRATAIWSPEDARPATDSENGNRFSGGNSYEGEVAYDAIVAARVVAGGFARYHYLQDRVYQYRSELGDVRSTWTGGSTATLGGFAEYLMHRSRFGFALETMAREAQSKATGARTLSEDARQFVRASAYVPMQWRENAKLTPAVDYILPVQRDTFGARYSVDEQWSARIALQVTL